MKKKGMSVKFITQAAVIAAIYVVLVVIFNYISFWTSPVSNRRGTYNTALLYTCSNPRIIRWMYNC